MTAPQAARRVTAAAQTVLVVTGPAPPKSYR